MTGALGPVIIGVGANLPSDRHGTPLQTCGAALDRLDAMADVTVTGCSLWYESAPVPISDQPWYVNGAARLETGLSPSDLLIRLLAVEADFGRARAEKNAPRTLDLDLLAYGDTAINGNIQVPHPRLQDRAFALLPLRDLVPDWRHPVLGRTVADMAADLPAAETAPDRIRALPAASGRRKITI
ncbi:MAG: 2-amino-4-hydroxy-6-hydroxymethyldihydropteridine diphosphokinase [Rhodospirillaceae bacterium]